MFPYKLILNIRISFLKLLIIKKSIPIKAMYSVCESTMCSSIKIMWMTQVVYTNMPLYSKRIHPPDDCEQQNFYIKVICSSSSSSGAELPLIGGSGLPNDILPFCSILNTGYPIFDLHLTKVLYNVVLPSILRSSFWSVG